MFHLFTPPLGQHPGGLESVSDATKTILMYTINRFLVVDGVAIKLTEERTGIAGIMNSLWFRHT